MVKNKRVDYYIERYNAQEKEWERLGVVLERDTGDIDEPWLFYRTSWCGLWIFDLESSTLSGVMDAIQDEYGYEWKNYKNTHLSEDI